MADPGVFRFNDLPDELKLKVYEQYFLDIQIQLCHWDDQKNNFCFNGMVSLNLERTSKAMCADSRKVRARLISKTLVISEEDFLEKTMKQLASNPKFKWLRSHIRTLILVLTGPPMNVDKFQDSWQKLVNCLPNVLNIEICLPCLMMYAPMSEQDFTSRPAFQDWIGSLVRFFVDHEVGDQDAMMATQYILYDSAIAMRATEDNGRVKLSYRRWALNPRQHSQPYFSVDTELNVGTDGLKITRKVIEGVGIHACWHGKGEPKVALEWETKKDEAKLANSLDENLKAGALVQATKLLSINNNEDH